MIQRLLMLVALLWLHAPLATAATLCATNGTELLAALNTARSNGQDDVIRLATGFYTIPSATPATFRYRPAADSGENFDVEISGGWSEFFSNPCGQQLESATAFDTVLVGNGTQIMELSTLVDVASHDITVRRLTFLSGGGADSPVIGAGLGIRLDNISSYTGTVRVDQCAFIDNISAQVAALAISTPAMGTSTVRLSNSLFQGNEYGIFGVRLTASSAPGIYVTNTTIVENTDLVAGSGSALRVSTVGQAQAFVANNNLWGNGNADLFLFGSNTILRNNNIGVLNNSSSTPAESTNNMSVMPVYAGGALDYTPAPGSALIDAGTKPPLIGPVPAPFANNWSTGGLDVRSRVRSQGATIDIGAFEATPDPLFSNSFE